MPAKDEKVYEQALFQALELIRGKNQCSLLEAMLGLHWALAKHLWKTGVNQGKEQALLELEHTEMEVAPVVEDPKGLRRPPPREKKPPKGKK